MVKKSEIQEYMRYRGDKLLVMDAISEHFGVSAVVKIDADSDGCFIISQPLTREVAARFSLMSMGIYSILTEKNHDQSQFH